MKSIFIGSFTAKNSSNRSFTAAAGNFVNEVKRVAFIDGLMVFDRREHREAPTAGGQHYRKNCRAINGKRFSLSGILMALVGHHESAEKPVAESPVSRKTPEVRALQVSVARCCRKEMTGSSPVCAIDDGDGFEAHELAAVQRRIEELYLSEIALLLQQHHYAGETVVMNLAIESFGQVAATVLQPDATEHPDGHRELEQCARQWRFPAILRHGECCVVVTGSTPGTAAG